MSDLPTASYVVLVPDPVGPGCYRVAELAADPPPMTPIDNPPPMKRAKRRPTRGRLA